MLRRFQFVVQAQTTLYCSFHLLSVSLLLSGLNYCTFRSLFWSLPKLHILAYNFYSFAFTLFSAGAELLNGCRNAENLIIFLEQLFVLAVLPPGYNILLQLPMFLSSTNKHTFNFFISLFVTSYVTLVVIVRFVGISCTQVCYYKFTND